MLGSIISAGASLLGGVLGNRSADKAAERNIALQKQFAKEGIQWKVADAKAAGIHPLAALGAQTHSFSPLAVGQDNIATGLAGAGQDIGRAIDATRPASAKVDAYTQTVQQLNLQRMGLENELLGTQIAKIRQVGSAPPMPSAGDTHFIPGAGDSPLVSRKALEATHASPGAFNQEPGTIVDLGYSRTPTGHHPVMSDDVKQRLEEDFIGSLMWSMRNRLGPTVGNFYGPARESSFSPPNVPLGDKEYWYYHPLRQEYQRFKMKKNWWGYSHHRNN